MMTLDETIDYTKAKARHYKQIADNWDALQSSQDETFDSGEHEDSNRVMQKRNEQLAEWLGELKKLRADMMEIKRIVLCEVGNRHEIGDKIIEVIEGGDEDDE